MAVERNYYYINESMAKTANDVNSFSDYRADSATMEYQSEVNDVYDIVDKIEEKKPDLLDKAKYMADNYSRKLANYYNNYYRNEAACPSVLISGGSNFPTGKKNKQNARRDTLHDEWENLQSYKLKIENLLYTNQPILSKDDQAIEKLETKLERLKQNQEDMKAANAYYRKEGKLEGCPVLTEKQINEIKYDWEVNKWYVGTPFPPYCLQNNNQNIHSVEKRIADLKATKEAGDSEKEYDGFTVKENTELMRLQIFFDDKPEPEIRNILKANGFKWAPSQEAWQRQLTNNARYAADRAIKQIQEQMAS